jgi:DNA-binding transcriptional LysR family regulator
MDTLELMRSFLAVVDSGGFTAAGRRLGKSKALISKHLSELEARLGARLINRTTRRIGVTEIGRAYAERARALIADLEQLEESVVAQSTTPRGLIRLTAPQALGELALVEMVAAFRARYPGVAVEVLLADRIVDLVGEGYDIGLRISAMPDSSLISRRLCETRLLLCAAPSYLEKNGRPGAIADIATHSVVADSNMRNWALWRFERAGEVASTRGVPVLTVNSAIAVRQALLAGLGLALCPEFAVAGDIRAKRLVSLHEDWTALPGLVVHLVYPHRHHLTARVRAFIDFAAEWYQPMPPWLRA